MKPASNNSASLSHAGRHHSAPCAPSDAAASGLECCHVARSAAASSLDSTATASAHSMLILEACAEVAKPEWWSDEGLKALSARVVRAAPDDATANKMRAVVLTGACPAWEAGPRSAAELREAAAHYDRAAALSSAPAVKAEYADMAARCRTMAEDI